MQSYLYPIDVVYLKNSGRPVSVSPCIQIYWVSEGVLDVQEYRTDSGSWRLERVAKNGIYVANQFSLCTIPSFSYEAVLFTVHPENFKESVYRLFPSGFVFEESRADAAEQLRMHLAQYVRCRFLGTDGAKLMAESLAIRVMMDLTEYFSRAESGGRTGSPDKLSRILSVCRTIEESFREELSLEGLAGKYHMTPQYLSRQFREVLHMTVFEYVNQVRLSHALSLLNSGHLSVERIAEHCGFANVRAFSHVFWKAYNMRPGEYRRQVAAGTASAGAVQDGGEAQGSGRIACSLRSAQDGGEEQGRGRIADSPGTVKDGGEVQYSGRIAASPGTAEDADRKLGNGRVAASPGTVQDAVGLQCSASHQLLESYASREKLRIPMLQETIPKLLLPEVSLGHKGTLWKKNYLRTLCVSDACYLLYEQYQKQIREAHGDLHFTYVRLQNLFWDEMHVYFETADGAGQMNFNLVDMVLDFLHSLGLFPHIVVDVLPSLLADSGRPGGIRDMEKWSDFLHKFITHCELRYERQYVELWRVSIGIYMENPSWEYYMDMESLFYFYQSTCWIVRDANSQIRIGSPWFLTNQKHEDSDVFLFLERCREHSVMPDFITLNYFPVVFPDEFGFLNHRQIFSRDTDDIKNYLDRVKGILKKRKLSQPRVILSDWNYSVGTNFFNDTLYRAVYTLKNILDNSCQGVEFCTDSLSDFMGGIPTDLQFFPGGIGLFTQQNIKKPVYYMFQLLNRLGSSVVASGEHYFITRAENSFQILLYHYVHYSNERSQENTFDIPYQDRYLPFANAKAVELTVPVFCDFAGEFHILETVINRKHGSAYDTWEQSGFIPLEQQESVSFIRSASVPFASSDSGVFADHVYRLTRTLEPLEMRLIEMTWR